MILAGITLFNPSLEGILRNIGAIIKQVDRVICIDNGTKDIEEIERGIKLNYPDVIIIKNKENLGIAKALNQMFKYAKEEGYEWVLTLDQDSVCPCNIISEYKKFMNLKNLGSLCPVLDDRNYENTDLIEGEVTYLDKCITSASLTSVEVWETVEGFFEELFIDFVDHDFSAKLIEHNYIIVRVNAVHLEHEIGHGKTVNFFGKRITVLNHSSFRKYYMTRNWIYYMKAHRDIINYSEERIKFIFFFLKTFLYEENKMEKMTEMFRGLRDAKVFCATCLKKE